MLPGKFDDTTATLAASQVSPRRAATGWLAGYLASSPRQADDHQRTLARRLAYLSSPLPSPSRPLRTARRHFINFCLLIHRFSPPLSLSLCLNFQSFDLACPRETHKHTNKHAIESQLEREIDRVREQMAIIMQIKCNHRSSARFGFRLEEARQKRKILSRLSNKLAAVCGGELEFGPEDSIDTRRRGLPSEL